VSAARPERRGRPSSTRRDKEIVEQAERPGALTGADPAAGADAAAGERYLLLADISGYTGFMAGVEHAHGVDFSAGIPAAYS